MEVRKDKMALIESRWQICFVVIISVIAFGSIFFPVVSEKRTAEANTDIACEWCEDNGRFPCYCSMMASYCVNEYREAHNLTYEEFPCYVQSNDGGIGWVE